MKYCLNCGFIAADNSTSKDNVNCLECNIPFQEDSMTGEMFESLSESEKEQYAEQLYAKIGCGVINKYIRKYGEPSFYRSWWYDKFEKMCPGQEALRYEPIEEWKARFYEKYGPHTQAYQDQLIENIRAERESRQSTQVTCPYCHSTNVNKMRDIDKILYGGEAGRLASLIGGSQWYCRNCKSKF